MGELVFHVQVGIISRMRLPHLPDDLKPALTEAAKCLGVALAAPAKRVVVRRGPDALGAALVGKEVDGVAQVFVAGTAHVHFVDLA